MQGDAWEGGVREEEEEASGDESSAECCRMDSKVSSLANLLYKKTVELTFENGQSEVRSAVNLFHTSDLEALYTHN